MCHEKCRLNKKEVKIFFTLSVQCPLLRPIPSALWTVGAHRWHKCRTPGSTKARGKNIIHQWTPSTHNDEHRRRDAENDLPLSEVVIVVDENGHQRRCHKIDDTFDELREGDDELGVLPSMNIFLYGINKISDFDGISALLYHLRMLWLKMCDLQYSTATNSSECDLTEKSKKSTQMGKYVNCIIFTYRFLNKKCLNIHNLSMNYFIKKSWTRK